MVELTHLESKIIKQVEYYFGDINMSRDKFMKDAAKENEGWITMDTMLKFKRLKSLSDDPSFILQSLTKSTSGLLQVNENKIRRNPEHVLPENLDSALDLHKDKSIYVKGFPRTCTLDTIMEWLELHGGKTLNVHMRRFPHQKIFKGSVFAVFEQKDDADKLLTSSSAGTFEGHPIIRSSLEFYWNRKKEEKETKLKAQAQKKAAIKAHQEAQLSTRMVVGALLELSGLPKLHKDSESSEEIKNESTIGEAGVVDASTTLTALNLKQWLIDKLGSDFPIGWIDVEPATGKAIVRFKLVDTAARAWNKIQEVFGNNPVTYMNCELNAHVLTDEEEKSHWKHILSAQQQKAQKRGTHRNRTAKPCGNKRRRLN